MPTFDMSEPAPVKRGPGRPRKSMREEPPIPQQRQSTRGPLVVEGRGGEQLSRKRKDDGGDTFHIPPEIIPRGWTYQWCAVSVSGNQDIVADQNLHFYENGWRPVPANRHEGRYMPVGHTGNIVRGGQMLMERPEQLTQQAQQENVAKARQQMADRDESLMGGKAKVRQNMRGGFEMDPQRYRGTGGDLRVSIDPAFDAPRPNYQAPEE